MQNHFRMEVPPLRRIVQERDVRDAIQSMLKSVFSHLGVNGRKANGLIRECLRLAGESKTEMEYENRAHALLEEAGLVASIQEKLRERSALIHAQIREHLSEGKTLDVGCGDGRVGALLSRDGHDVHLADVYAHPQVQTHGLPFSRFRQGEALPFRDQEFDNAVVLTVFHHAENPEHALREVHRVLRPGGRVAVIESVYGVEGDELTRDQRKAARAFVDLLPKQQRWANVFFDHFYNRVLHYSASPNGKVNVPFNFNTPAEWNRLFKAHGFDVEKTIHLGVDQPTVPEYHTLHVLQRRE
ncbi:class I SAM-dependent methyltransferase [Candidatus Micrarchaeota archaeon]|nr:class I SAM-dependent methyltransferase [Candidatus Micrarchaeota archaeon]